MNFIWIINKRTKSFKMSFYTLKKYIYFIVYFLVYIDDIKTCLFIQFILNFNLLYKRKIVFQRTSRSFSTELIRFNLLCDCHWFASIFNKLHIMNSNTFLSIIHCCLHSGNNKVVFLNEYCRTSITQGNWMIANKNDIKVFNWIVFDLLMKKIVIIGKMYLYIFVHHLRTTHTQSIQILQIEISTFKNCFLLTKWLLTLRHLGHIQIFCGLFWF